LAFNIFTNYLVRLGFSWQCQGLRVAYSIESVSKEMVAMEYFLIFKLVFFCNLYVLIIIIFFPQWKNQTQMYNSHFHSFLFLDEVLKTKTLKRKASIKLTIILKLTANSSLRMGIQTWSEGCGFCFSSLGLPASLEQSVKEASMILKRLF